MSIYKAIENLPEELITPEIAQAAIEEGKLELLGCMPQKYITDEIILSIIEKNTDSYSYNGFDLSNIPEQLRRTEVCEFAIKRNKDNIFHVPKNQMSSGMLDEMMVNVERKLKYLHLFPKTAWTLQHLVNGVNSIYSKTTQNSGPRGGYRNPTTTTDLKPVAIFMSYVPNKLKNKEFYAELLDSKMSIDDIDTLTPSQFKDRNYYLRIAQKKFSLVPESFYDYDILSTGLKSNKISLSPYYSSSHYNNDPKDREKREQQEKLRGQVFAIMDAKMADKIGRAHV